MHSAASIQAVASFGRIKVSESCTVEAGLSDTSGVAFCLPLQRHQVMDVTAWLADIPLCPQIPARLPPHGRDDGPALIALFGG
jgi:hypothetical protein